MSWVQTISGRAVDLFLPDRQSIVIEDIAASLSRIPRFNGHTREFYSVAQHCYLVSLYLERSLTSEPEFTTLLLAGLLHDAHEAYLGDITSPVAAMLECPRLKTAKSLFDRMIEEQLIPGTYRHRPSGLRLGGTCHIDRQEIHQADAVLLATEKRDLMAKEQRPWQKLALPWNGMKIVPWSMAEAEHRFLNRYAELTGGIQVGSLALRQKLRGATSIEEFLKEQADAD